MEDHTDVVTSATSTILIKMKAKDTPTGISKATLERMAKILNLSQTEVIHLALRQFADMRIFFTPTEDEKQ